MLLAELHELMHDYYKHVSGKKDAMIFTKPPLSFSFFNDELKTKRKSSFFIKSINSIDFNIQDFVYANTEDTDIKKESRIRQTGKNINLKPSKKEKKIKLNIVEKTGVQHIIFSEKNIEHHIIYLSFLTGERLDIHNFVCCSLDVYEKILTIKNKNKSRQSIPKMGIYTGSVDQAGNLKYIPFEHQILEKPIIHNIKTEILKDIEYFYETVPILIKEGEKGTRKILIAGIQGTGKSSLINEIVLKYKNSHCILIATQLDVLAKHQQLCGKYNIPCLSVLEDCENFFDDNNSNILNFLSGALEPLNSKGSYTIFTTNHPDRISDRIKYRPERIDDVFILSTLNKNDSHEVFYFYFSKFLTKDFDYNSIKDLFDGYTGAEIMKLASDVKKEAAYEYKGDYSRVDKNYIFKIFSKNNEKYKKLKLIDTGKIKTNTNSTERIGFNIASNFLE